MAVKTDPYTFVNGTIADALEVNARFDELYDLQDGGIDSTNMNMSATYAWQANHTWVSTTTSTDVINITANSLSTGSAIAITSNSTSTATRYILDVYQQNSSAVNAVGLRVLQNSDAPATYIRTDNLSLDISSLSTKILPGIEQNIFEGNDVYLSLYASSLGTWGSGLVLSDITSGTGVLNNKWGIIRQTSSGSNDLHFTFGTNADFSANTSIYVFNDGGRLTIDPVTAAADSEIYLDSTGGASRLRLDRSSTSYEGSIEFYTAGSRKWEVGLRNNSTENFYISSNSQDIFSINNSTASVTFDTPATTSDAYTFLLDDLTTGDGFVIYSNSSSAGSKNLTFIHNDNPLAASTICLHIKQDADDESFYIDGNSTTADVMLLQCNSLTTGSIASFQSNSSSTSARNLVEILNQNSSADAAKGLYIQQEGDQESLYIEHNAGGSSPCLYIDNNASTSTASFNTVFSSGSDIYGLTVGMNNSGAGNGVCFAITGGPDFLFEDFSGLFTFAASAAGSIVGEIPVKTSGGSTAYIKIYDT